jgi:hypothetical protein
MNRISLSLIAISSLLIASDIPSPPSESVNISLSYGWNMVSSPINGKKIDVSLLKSKSSNVSSIYGFDGSSYTVPKYIESGKGY